MVWVRPTKLSPTCVVATRFDKTTLTHWEALTVGVTVTFAVVTMLNAAAGPEKR